MKRITNDDPYAIETGVRRAVMESAVNELRLALIGVNGGAPEQAKFWIERVVGKLTEEIVIEPAAAESSGPVLSI